MEQLYNQIDKYHILFQKFMQLSTWSGLCYVIYIYLVGFSKWSSKNEHWSE